MFTVVKNIHFVGIGGIGMSGIAEILINQGFTVSGSDLAESENTESLRRLGADVKIGHDAKNVSGAEVVVYSSAVSPEKNPETAEAARRGIPIIRRAEMLAEVSRLKYCLAVAGTHGKTTTTSILGLILVKAGIDPTVIVGGRLADFGGSNARLGNGEWTAVEADEFDRSFLQLAPTVAVINNVESEHLDVYKDFDDLKSAFVQFANSVPFNGFAAVGLDDAGVGELLDDLKKKVVTFGLSRHCDYRAEDIRHENLTSTFKLFRGDENLGELKINMPGLHNLKNALGAAATALAMGIDFKYVAEALSDFHGVYRRFDVKGEKNGVLVVDDYAHHHTEVKAALAAARLGWKKRIVAVFQPHTYTRTKAFWKEFGRSFFDADILVVTDVYPAREKPIEGVDGELIARAAQRFGHKDVHYVKNKADLFESVKKLIRPGDMLITLGAGDIVRLADKLVE